MNLSKPDTEKIVEENVLCYPSRQDKLIITMLARVVLEPVMMYYRVVMTAKSESAAGRYRLAALGGEAPDFLKRRVEALSPVGEILGLEVGNGESADRLERKIPDFLRRERRELPKADEILAEVKRKMNPRVAGLIKKRAGEARIIVEEATSVGQTRLGQIVEEARAVVVGMGTESEEGVDNPAMRRGLAKDAAAIRMKDDPYFNRVRYEGLQLIERLRLMPDVPLPVKVSLTSLMDRISGLGKKGVVQVLEQQIDALGDGNYTPLVRAISEQPGIAEKVIRIKDSKVGRILRDQEAQRRQRQSAIGLGVALTGYAKTVGTDNEQEG